MAHTRIRVGVGEAHSRNFQAYIRSVYIYTQTYMQKRELQLEGIYQKKDGQTKSTAFLWNLDNVLKRVFGYETRGSLHPNPFIALAKAVEPRII